MLQKNKLIIVLTVFVINSIFLQCKEENNESVNISFLEKNGFYSYIIESPKDIIYSTPSFFELKENTVNNKKKLIFDYELKKFKPLKLSSQRIDYDILYISNTLKETNFAANHNFEYDLQLNKEGNLKTNIFYPYDLEGSYDFQINNEDLNLIGRALFNLSLSNIISVEPNKKFNNIIIIDNKNSKTYVGDFYKKPEYSLVLTMINKILLENISKEKVQKRKFTFISTNYIERFKSPPLQQR